MSEITVFAFDSAAVRTVTIDGEPWFVAGDVAKILGFAHVPHMIRMLEEDQKGVHIVDPFGGGQESVIISESGLYSCIFKSRRPEAKRFRKWVTSEVLPSIRKTGTYSVPGLGPEPILSRVPAHAADLTVAASRTFNALLRSSRAAGLPLPRALRVANAGTLRKTGVDLLAELDADDYPDELDAAETPDPGSIARFFRDWLQGDTPHPVCICDSGQLYAAYVRWCRRAGEKPRSHNSLSHFVKQQKFWEVACKSRFAGVDRRDKEIRSRMVIPPQRILEATLRDGHDYRKRLQQTEAEWATEGYLAFSRSLGEEV